MRAQALHPDVLLVTSAVLALNCVVVRAELEEPAGEGEVFVIDSPVLPEELAALPAVIEQAGFPAPNGLLATHGDWDHLLGRLAFPGLALGCAESTVERLGATPGEAQRELRLFDEELLIERMHPLALGSVQALPVPGSCELGERQLELHPADGHTPDGMAVLVPWANVLVAGDYLSAIELPTLSDGVDVQDYLATLARLRALVAGVDHVVPGHGPVLAGDSAVGVLEEDAAYLSKLGELGAAAELPPSRRTARDRRAHAQNAARM